MLILAASTPSCAPAVADEPEGSAALGRLGTAAGAWLADHPKTSALALLLLGAQCGLVVLLLHERKRRQRADRRIRERASVDGVVAQVLGELADGRADRRDAAAERALERFARIRGARRASLWLLSDDRLHVERQFIWGERNEEMRWRDGSLIDAAALMATLQAGSRFAGAANHSEWSDGSLVLPLVDGGVPLGAVVIGPRDPMSTMDTVEGWEMSARVCALAMVAWRNARAAAESEGLSDAVLASMTSNVAILDRNGRIIRVNGAWRRFAARHAVASHRDAFVGVDYLELCRSAAAAGLEAPALIAPRLERVLSGAGDGFAFEHSCGRNGGEYWLELRVEPLGHAKGGAVLSYTDITRRKEAEREAVSRLHVLAHVSRVATLGALSGSLVHELNQPLTAILSNAQVAAKLLAVRGAESGEVHEILRDIVSDTERASEVIRRLRKLLRPGELERAAVDVNEIVSNTIRLMADDMVIRRVRVSVELESDLPDVLGDAVQLQQVVLNLVVNALDAVEQVVPSERQITVATEHRAGSVTMRVTDRGPGVPSELLPRMFEPFVTSKAGGLGLGLYITRSIVAAHGGEIQASANPEGGLVVEVRLPAKRESASGAEPLLAGMPAS